MKREEPKKSKSFTFRVPENLRVAFAQAARDVNITQASFMIGGALGLLKQIGKGATYKDLLLPKGFLLPYRPELPARMVSIRATPDAWTLIHGVAPRMWHSATRVILWGTALRLHHDTSINLPIYENEAERKPKAQFRVPVEVRNAVSKHAPNVDLPLFLSTAAEQFLKKLDTTPIKDLMLPKGFSIPTTDSKIITVPIPQNDFMRQGLYETAPQMWHSIGRIMSLSAALKVRLKK